ncbi:MAG: hypothetical protein SXA11_06860 [Cyanobacteriota bacterium]|nr:hypothetical protein [Cyanobacteriota bacterium]
MTPEDVGDFYVGTERWWKEKKRSLVKFSRVYDLERDNYVVLINTNLTTCTYKKGSKIPTTEITENRNYIVQLDKDIDVYDFSCLEEGQACIFKGRNENGLSPRFTDDEINLAINKALNR